MPIDSRSVAEIALELARFMGDLEVEGTATSGTSTTLVDTANLLFENDDDLKGAWVGIYEGTAIGDERPITASSASADSITCPAFSATPDTESKYFITRRWRPRQYLDAIASAVRRSQTWELFSLDDISGHLHELITLGDILSTDGNGNGQMEEFTSGGVPNGWTADGNTTSASDSDTDDVRRGGFSYKMTSDGTNLAQITQAIKYFEKYAGTKITLRAQAKGDVADRALIRVDDGPSTAVTDTHADGANVWEELTAELSVSNSPTGIDVDLEISAGSAVNAQWDDVRLIWDEGVIYEYDLPSRLVYLSAVYRELKSDHEGTLSENAWVPIPRDCWYVQRGANPKLIFRPEKFTPPRNVHIRLEGQAHPALITVDTPSTAYAETVEANAEYVRMYGKWYLLNSMPFEAMDETVRRLRSDAQRDFLLWEEQSIIQPWPGAVLVQGN